MTLLQLKTLQAVVECGSFQAGAKQLHKTHPSVIAIIKSLEEEIGFPLFDRTQYRATLTAQGLEFFQRTDRVLEEMNKLTNVANNIATGVEPEINVVVGDITPVELVLPHLKMFFNQHKTTQLNLHFDNIYGPNERLLSGEVDFIVHHIDQNDKRYEYIDFTEVEIIPVAAPGYLATDNLSELSYEFLQQYTQCVIRDTSSAKDSPSYHVLSHSQKVTVGDQFTKKQVILQGLGWGHMPLYLIDDDLQAGRLINLTGKKIKSHQLNIVIASLAEKLKGPVATELWQYFLEEG